MQTISVASRQEFLARVKPLAARFPEALSAYRSSGRMPISNLFSLPTGAVIGAILSALTTVILLGLTIAIVLLCVLLAEGLKEVLALISLAPMVLGIVLGALGGLVAFGAGSYVIGASVGYAGYFSKNRNEWAAGIAGLIAGIFGFFLIRWVMHEHFPDSLLDGESGKVVRDFAKSLWIGGSVSWWIAGIAFVGLSFFMPIVFVSGKHFCETCDCYMKSVAVPKMSVDGLAMLIDGTGDAEIIRQAIESKGQIVESKLKCCDECGDGYLESSVRIKGVWPIDKWPRNSDDAIREWVAYSAKVGPEITQAFSDVTFGTERN